MPMKEVELKHAAVILSAIVDRAAAGEPVVITRNGSKDAVVISFQDYERLSKAPSLSRLLAAFPGDASDLPRR
jgi:antitoxin Phd